jgi:hypothetical protein
VDGELPGLDGGPPKETPGGKLKFRGGFCAETGVAERHRISAAIKPGTALKNRWCLGVVVFIGNIR